MRILKRAGWVSNGRVKSLNSEQRNGDNWPWKSTVKREREKWSKLRLDFKFEKANAKAVKMNWWIGVAKTRNVSKGTWND